MVIHSAVTLSACGPERSEQARLKVEHDRMMWLASEARAGRAKKIGGKWYRLREAGPFWYPEDSGDPIVCGCGGRAFENTYGDYELFAKCSTCGATDSVYSG